MAAESSRSSTSSADSYIGSLISLTSKSEIRYEGILYNINTEESSIGLRNVRSFGSEGRKKDGPQIMPSDKVYEYILFRGSDIKDLQVKTSPPVQPPTQPINSDPAIIQSHYPRPPLMSSTLPATAAGNPMPDPSTTHNPQLGHPGSSFQGGMPLYQPDGTMGTWGPSPPPPNVNSMPMYWPGFYAPPNGLPQLHQQSMFRPMPPPSIQQYPNFNPSNLPEYSTATSANLTTTTTLPSSLPPVPPMVLTTEPLPNFLQTKLPNSVVSTPPVSGGLPPVSGGLPPVSPLTTTSPDVIAAVPPLTAGSNLGYQGMSHLSAIGRTSSIPNENPTPSLVTPGQLLQSGQGAVVSSQSSQAVEPPPPTPPPPTEPSAPPMPVSTEAQPPILPLPTQPRNAPRMNGASYNNHHNYRGRERGRGSGASRPVMKFTEEFDFTAMNEKFNKDEVWGSLGKTNKSDEDALQDENNAPALPNFEVKPVYSKDDFFDTLSCNSNDHQSNNGRTRFSEQMKLDTETFGEFSRYRGGRGGRGPYRGGRFRGGGGGSGYYHGRGYGYVNRGRGGGRNFARDY